ncbi:ribonuclease like 2 precursor [Triplophysa rosa]|uniref:Ribonuclease like 2 n=1 Tax=Triplophysa rosa TaxID=992332 RepID=A0A9W7WM14_TRIRA|nr:ribonuclease like 2 precursor [Triplophysa rosa]
MEAHLSAVILLLILCSSDVKADDVPADVKPGYEKFLRQHVYEDMNEKKCDSEMSKRHITEGQTNNDCKTVNTFITASKKEIIKVCNGAGKNYKGSARMYVSNQPFAVVKCELQSGERYPKCEYRGKKSTYGRYIVVACDSGWPTHYDGDIIMTD